MKISPLSRRRCSQQGSVRSNILCALGGAVVGAVIAVIFVGLCAAIALPTISSAYERSREAAANRTAQMVTSEAVGSRPMPPITQSMSPRYAREATAQRNAQSLASVYAAGNAAGVEWKAHDVDSAVSELSAGVAPKSGPFAGRTFSVPSRSINDLNLAKDYLRWDNDADTLNYDSTDADPTN